MMAQWLKQRRFKRRKNITAVGMRFSQVMTKQDKQTRARARVKTCGKKKLLHDTRLWRALARRETACYLPKILMYNIRGNHSRIQDFSICIHANSQIVMLTKLLFPIRQPLTDY